MPSINSLAAFVAQTRAEHGERAERLLQLYPANDDAGARIASRTAFSYRNFYWQNWTWARSQCQTGTAPVYYYEFTRESPIPETSNYAENPAREFGAFHCAEIPYVFRNLQVRDWPWSDHDRALSDLISDYWVAFAQSGNPNGSGRPRWEEFDTRTQQVLQLGDSVAMTPISHRARLEFWDEFYARRRDGSQIAA